MNCCYDKCSKYIIKHRHYKELIQPMSWYTKCQVQYIYHICQNFMPSLFICSNIINEPITKKKLSFHRARNKYPISGLIHESTSQTLSYANHEALGRRRTSSFHLYNEHRCVRHKRSSKAASS